MADVDDAGFRADVDKLKGNIHAGDIYQVVPARAFTVECPNALAAYRALRETNPSPYMFYVRGADYELFGASPESNLKFTPEDRQVLLYPIAGRVRAGSTRMAASTMNRYPQRAGHAYRPEGNCGAHDAGGPCTQRPRSRGRAPQPAGG